MISAWRYNESDEDQRELHQFTPNREVPVSELVELGILYWNVDVTGPLYLEKVDTISHERGYKNKDIIDISKATLPNFEEKIKTFFEEHIHEDEEIRFILEGSGYFDVRDKSDQWIRVACKQSDLLPAGIYHRFTLDTANHLKAMRLFKENPKWIPINRSKETDTNQFHVEYLHNIAKEL
ncbi:1,2-dihydroxy-3-keto-5-methylthiopentene dioxygenase [Physocladia obscura]|uniref:Acireductone dioxygenase n=1 Tax=Physocladia obscura TaxID=109957 RepID=A0AAD5XF53_9FUNG|nr:1,2-dihydroxy-3-keto-5-methylthiopentene dioxygenase [Physocladia obscura]